MDQRRLRHLLGGALAATAVCGLLPVDSFDPLWAASALAGILAALFSPRFFAGRGERFWSRAGWVVFAYALADLAFTLTTNRQATLGSVVRLSLVLTTLRTMQPRRRREDMQLILLSMFLAALGGALSLSPMFVVQVFLFIPLSGGVLFLVNRQEGDPGAVPPEAHWESFSRLDFASRLRRAWDWRFGLFLTGAAGVVVLSGALIFAVLPRFRFNRSVPFLEMPGSGRTGVSEGMSVGSSSEIVPDESPAMRVDTPGRMRPARSPYWRMNVLDRHLSGESESSFSLSPGVGAESTYELRAAGPNWYSSSVAPVAPSPGFASGEWVVHLEANVSRYLPAHGAIGRIRFDKPQEWRESPSLRSVRLDRVSTSPMHLRMDVGSELVAHTPPGAELRRLRELKSADPARYPGTLLALPADGASRTALRASVAEAFAGEPVTTANLAPKLTAWLHSRHAYALRDGYAVHTAAPGQPRDYLVRWLRSGATGWCEHFAGSFVLLAREAGFPARLVSGFSGGEWNEADSYLLVRMKHAHAWCEVFDAKSGYWLRVDPTPVGAASGSEEEGASRGRGIGSFSGLAAWYDGVTMLWFRSVVNFEESDQREVAKSALARFSAWRDRLASGLRAWRDSAKSACAEWSKAPARAAPWVLAAIACLFILLRARRLSLALRGRFSTRETEDAYVRGCRREAARILRRLDALAASGREVPESVRAPVECIRFGRPGEWGDPGAVFAAAKRHQGRKGGRR